MRRAYANLLSLLVLSAPIAFADELADGVLITHYVPGFGGPGEPHGCDDYMQLAAIGTCEDQNETVEFEDDVAIVEWYVLATWPEAKEFCGVEFGLGDYDPELVDVIDHAPCGVGAQTIPSYDPPWPEPNSGIAVTWDFDTPPSGNFVPVYMFQCRVYGSSYGTTTIPITADPMSSFLGFANCEAPPSVWYALESGVLGIHEPGDWVCPPGLAVEARACCLLYGPCLLLREEDCAEAGGVFFEEWDTCDPNPCPDPDLWYACCHGEDLHSCQMSNQLYCQAVLEGVWMEGIESCFPNPCEEFSPADETSWSRIKTLYAQ